MAQINQYYIPGQEFQLCSSTELSTTSEDWIWNGRTLVGLIDKNGIFYDNVNSVPSATMYGFDNYISGIWSLNKSQKPLKIHFLGTTERCVSAIIGCLNTKYPLADSRDPYHQVSSVDNSEENPYVDMYYDSNPISIDILKDDQTHIRYVRSGETDIPTDQQTQIFEDWDSGNGDLVRSLRENGLSISFKGICILKAFLSGDVNNNTIRLNGNDYNITNPNYVLEDIGRGISSLTMYTDDIGVGCPDFSDATSSFVNLGTKLLSIDFLNGESLSSAVDMANGCSSLTGVVLTGLTALQSADRMFKNCSNLTHLSISNEPTMIQRLGDSEVFGNCDSLVSVRYYGRLLDYQDNITLTQCFGDAEFLYVDVNRQETHSELTGGRYGAEVKHLITTSDNIKILTFDTSMYPGASSGIAGDRKYFEAGIKIGTLPTPSLNGYKVINGTNGWVYHDDDSNLCILYNISKFDEDTTCSAALELRKYTITYNPNKGTINESVKPDYTIVENVQLPTNVIRDKYDFLGWFDNSELTGDRVYGIPLGSTGDKHFYAKWMICQYSVNATINTEIYTPEGRHVFENDPTGGQVLGTGSYDIGTTVTLTAAPSEGFEFKQWQNGSSSTTYTVTLNSGNVGLSATFNSLNQSLKEYFMSEADVPSEGQATILGLNDIGKGVVKYLNVPGEIEI